MGNDPPRDQIHLGHQAIAAAPVLDNLAVALHCLQAPAQGFQVLLLAQVQAAGDLIAAARHAGLAEKLLDEFAAGDGACVALGLALRVGIMGNLGFWFAAH